MDTTFPLIRGWKQWLVTAISVGSFTALTLYSGFQSSEDAVLRISQVLVVPFLFLAVFVPQAVLVAALAYFWARLSFQVITVLLLLLLLANLALGATFGLATLVLGAVSILVGLPLVVLVGAALYLVATNLWHLSPRVALIPAATFIVFKLFQLLLMNHLRGA